MTTSEAMRLAEDAKRTKNWKRWGPYLSERQWSTVREDYSADSNSWTYLSHEASRSRAYRWGEDGILGLTDRECRLCFALSLWNGKDAILKERLYGLTGPQGNHGEDIKEVHYYLDSTPTHSYMKGLYKYPQYEFPYANLLEENRRRGLSQPEYELIDSGAFDQGRYFDVYCEYAKAAPDDILIKITVINRARSSSLLHILPTLWFRNNWTWGAAHEACKVKPSLALDSQGFVLSKHESLGEFQFSWDTAGGGTPKAVLFTENESNDAKLFGAVNKDPYVKDAFHDYVIKAETNKVNAQSKGTKTAPYYEIVLKPGESRILRLRLSSQTSSKNDLEKFFASEFEAVFAQRIKEADEFYGEILHPELSPEEKSVSRQAYAGLLWSKQFYHYIVKDWLAGDSLEPKPPATRNFGRNHDWTHVYSRDILSVPDKWEYPWFAAWDLAFHMLPFAKIDPQFAKEQLILLLREWYMHPNGQLPAYEFALSDVNPPVHAWAAWRVYKIEAKRGNRDIEFLEKIFQKLLLNFTWWVNRKDFEGNSLFSGGFLGLDNIGVFDRSKPLPTGGYLQQADATAWMGFYCLTMLSMALELAEHDSVYEDMASKFFEHFVMIMDAINEHGGSGLWNEEDGFYYDALRLNDESFPLKVRSLVGLMPLIAVEVLDGNKLAGLQSFKKRMHWFLDNRPDLADIVSYCEQSKEHPLRLLAVPSKERLERILKYLLDENEFLSPFGIRSLSKVHLKEPFVLNVGDEEFRVDYVPGESNSLLFGGNSNWRGPVWFPINYLIIEALERYHHFYGDELKVACPTNSGNLMNLREVAGEISRRLSTLFLKQSDNTRPSQGSERKFAEDPNWSELIWFYEYFDADSGRGLGANHQTGWTALVIRCLEKCHKDNLIFHRPV